MSERIDRFSLVVGVGVLVLGGFATAGTLGNVLNKGSLLAGLALGVAALAIAASTLGASRVRRSPESLSVQTEHKSPEDGSGRPTTVAAEPSDDQPGDEVSRYGPSDV